MNNIPQNKRNSSLDPISDCLDHMSAHGLPFPSGKQFKLTNKYERYSADEKETKIDEWYIGQEDEDGLLVTYGSWSTGEKHVFYSWNDELVDSEIRNRRLLKIQEQRKEYERIKEEEQKEASFYATEFINKESSLIPLNQGCEYHIKKGIKPLGGHFAIIRGSETLIIPIRDIDNKIWSLQYIYWSNEENRYTKRFLRRGKWIGNFHIINNETLSDNIIVYVCEGWATGVSIYEAIKSPGVRVVAAMGKDNILHAIESIKSKYQCNFIIASDSDEYGKKSSEDAAKKTGCKITYPECTVGKDFNDVHQQYGLLAVKQQLDKTVEFESEAEIARRLACKLLEVEDPCKDFNLDDLPPILRDHVIELCSSNGAHKLAVLGSLLVSASAAIGRRFIIEKADQEVEGYFNRLYTNIWMMFLAPSGEFKSTALNLGARYVQDHRDAIHRQTLPLKQELAYTLKKAEQLELLRQIREYEIQNIMFPDRSTPEALLQFLGQGRAGAIFHTEFGGFVQELSKPNNIGLMALLTKIYDADKIIEDATKTQGCNYIQRPFLSIYGVSTLSQIQDNLTEKDVQGGFFARFNMYKLPEQKEMPKMLPSKTCALVNTYNDFCARLISINGDRRYRFTRDGADYFKSIATDIWNLKKSFAKESRETLNPFVNRWPASILKISMIMQLFYDPTKLYLTVEAIKAAYSVIQPAIKSTLSLFGNELGVSEFELQCNKVFAYICEITTQRKQVTSRMIQQFCHLKPKPTEEILEKLIGSGKIKKEKSGRATIYSLELQ